MLWWIFATVFGIIVYKYFITPHQYWKNRNVPHLKPCRFFVNMATILSGRKGPAEWIQEIYNTSDHSRYIGLVAFARPALMIKDLDLLKQICVKDFDHFPEHQCALSGDPLFGKSLFSLKGQKWRHMRSTLSPAFTGSKMRAMFVLMSECAEQFVDYFSKNVDPDEPLTVEMKDAFSRFANDVIATTAFGIKCDSLNEQNNEFYLAGKNATNFGGPRTWRLIGHSHAPGLMKVLNIKLIDDDVSNFFRNIIVSTMEIREKQGIIRPDMIHLLMEARKGKLRYEEASKKVEDDAGFATVQESYIGKDTKQALIELSDDDVTAQALNFFIAGFDSTSAAMCHMAYELAINEDVQKKLQKEIDTTLMKCNGKITYDTIIKMNYLDMVVSETLRKWPVAIVVDRICVEPYTISPEKPGEQPIHLQKDDIIAIPTFAIHRDPKYFPDPDRFDPERFNDENKAKILPQSFMPFGIGPRNCIGSRFALLEVKIVFVHLVSKFSLVIVEKSEVPLNITKLQMNLNAANGFWLGVKSRK